MSYSISDKVWTEDGITYREFSRNNYFRFLPMFYMIPRECLITYPKYLNLPRNIHTFKSSPDACKLVTSEEFLWLILNCYAYNSWNSFLIPGQYGIYKNIPDEWRHYALESPLVLLSYQMVLWELQKIEELNDFNLQGLFDMPTCEEVPWLSEENFLDHIEALTTIIIAEKSLQPLIDEMWKLRQHEDYGSLNGNKKDFYQKWNGSRKYTIDTYDTIPEFVQTIAVNDIENDIFINMIYDQLSESFSKKDFEIFKLYYAGYTQQEIADKIGYKTPSAVNKRLDKLRTYLKNKINET